MSKPLGNMATRLEEAFEMTRELPEDSNKHGNFSDLAILNDMIHYENGPLLVAIVGVAGMGKTALASHLLLNTPKQGQKVLYSADLDMRMLTLRMVANYARVDISQMLSASLSDKAMHRLSEALGNMHQMGLSIVDTADMGINEIIKHATAVNDESPIGMLVIDGIQLIEPGSVDKSVLKMRRLAKDLGCPVILTFPVSNSAVSERVSQRPLMRDIKNETVEEAADIILGVYRDEIVNPETLYAGIMDISFLKNKNGPRGSLRAMYHSAFLRLRDLSPEEQLEIRLL